MTEMDTGAPAPAAPAPAAPEPSAGAPSDPRGAAAPPVRAADLVAANTQATTPADPSTTHPVGAAKVPAGGTDAPGSQVARTGGAAPGRPGTAKTMIDEAKSRAKDTAKKAASEAVIGQPVPEIPLSKEAAGRAAGQAAKTALASALGIPPKVLDMILKAAAHNRAGRMMLRNIPLPDSVREGLGIPDVGSGKGRTLAPKAALATLLLPPLLLLMVVLLIVNSAALSGLKSQPDTVSDNKVAPVIPKGWEPLLESAANTTAGRPPFAKVPWTILAGLVQTQTDFGRYSPYDSVDRDPGRNIPEITPGGGAGGAQGAGFASGAGPGPIAGVSGPGETASFSPDHIGPPPGDLSHQLGWFTYAIRMKESGGDYTVQTKVPGSDACGAYQYLSKTWAKYGGYPNACVAPPSVQDRRAVKDFIGAWNRFHMWQQIAANHFAGPGFALDPTSWNACPAICDPHRAHNPTVWAYIDAVMKLMWDGARKSPDTTALPAAFHGPPAPALAAAGRPGASGPLGMGGGPAAASPSIPGGGSGTPSPSATEGSGTPSPSATEGSGTPSPSSTGSESGAPAGCPVATATPPIGGQGAQGSGPYLLTPAAASDLRNRGGDPNDPCASSDYVAQAISRAANVVYNSHGRIPFTGGSGNVGITTQTTNDYPWNGLTKGGDPWGMAFGQCVSFVAWMIYKSYGGTQRPPAVGDPGWSPSDAAKVPIRASWRNAGDWNVSAANAGFAVNDTPAVGSVAQWVNGSDSGQFTVGHVAYVTGVNADGSIDLAQYNLREDSKFSTLHLPRGGGMDRSNGNGAFFVSWPDHFLHIHDGGAVSTAAAQLPQGVPQWKPNGTPQDMANALVYWEVAIDISGIFADRSSTPGTPCALPPEDPKKPWSIGYKISFLWQCEIDRMPDLSLVTGVRGSGDAVRYQVESDRFAAAQTLISEAMEVSYGGGGWRKSPKCDNRSSGRQGVFPMTKQEAAAANVSDRCDQEQNIDGAARLVLSVEKDPPDQRDHRLGMFQPMVGGWQRLSIAMGQDLQEFSTTGPGNSFSQTDACLKVMQSFLKTIGPHAGVFSNLRNPPKGEVALLRWARLLADLERADHITDPALDPACQQGSWAPGYDDELAEVAVGLAADDPTGNIQGLGQYYRGVANGFTPDDPRPGKDSLVIPRLAVRPLNAITPPLADDVLTAGPDSGSSTPLAELAVDYGWFYGGEISPFNTAGQLIGLLAGGSGVGVQSSVGPDGCPTSSPPNTLRGADGFHVPKGVSPIYKICADSVAQARTPQAAMAIKWAMTAGPHGGLGWPYSELVPPSNPNRDLPGHADCSSYVTRAYKESGAIPNLFPDGRNAPNGDAIREASWARPLGDSPSLEQVPSGDSQNVSMALGRPGDIVMPFSGHVYMKLADGFSVEESHTGDISHVFRDGRPTAFWIGWVDPSRVS